MYTFVSVWFHSHMLTFLLCFNSKVLKGTKFYKDFFGEKVSLYCPGGLWTCDSPASTPQITWIIGAHHCTSLKLLELNLRNVSWDFLFFCVQKWNLYGDRHLMELSVEGWCCLPSWETSASGFNVVHWLQTVQQRSQGLVTIFSPNNITLYYQEN